MAVSPDQPISIGNLAAYHESVWGGGSGPRETLWLGNARTAVLPITSLDRYSSFVAIGCPVSGDTYVECEFPATLGAHQASGLNFNITSVSNNSFNVSTPFSNRQYIIQGKLNI